MKTPTPEQIEQFIKFATDEAGPACGDEWFEACCAILRAVVEKPHGFNAALEDQCALDHTKSFMKGFREGEGRNLKE